jgi:hypothetical protein
VIKPQTACMAQTQDRLRGIKKAFADGRTCFSSWHDSSVFALSRALPPLLGTGFSDIL